MQRVQGLLNQPELKVKDIPALEESQEALDGLLNTLLGSKRKSAFREYVESIVYAVAIALLIRTAVVEPFKIPTGSMIPTLEINDHIFVSKFSYGVRIPFSGGVRIGSGNPIERGDIIVFENPEAGEDEGKDFIKRVVGIEGDTVRMENNHLWVNGEQVPTEILEDNPCDDGSGRNCGFQEETGAKGPYKTQHVIPTAYRTVEGDTLEIIGKRIGVQPETW